MKRVVVTGMAGISPLGNDWASVRAHIESGRNCVVRMNEWDKIEGMHTRLAAPAKPFELPAHYNRKTTRSMGRLSIMATLSSEWALAQAGLLGDPLVKSGQMGVSYGSSSGTHDSVADFARMVFNNSTEGITANTYIKMMGHTAPVNIGVFHGLRGRVITTSSACTSGSQGIGYAYEAIHYGQQLAMVAGGGEELHPTNSAVFDTLFATSTRNDEPEATPRPYDAARDGLVLGEGAGTLILEEYEHAKARGAHIYATHPNSETMAIAMQLALADAGLSPQDIGYVNAHGTATDRGDVAESQATASVFGDKTPISTLKSYMGHTLGACGALEAWMAIEMMNSNWFAPTLNLTQIGEGCEGVDHIMGEARSIDCEFIMSNNFAFGGINTSLIFKRVS